MEYTKGEWIAWRFSKHHNWKVSRGSGIQEYIDLGLDGEADAQLIASSPDTAEALQELISFLIHDGLGTNTGLVPIINKGTKALKKAGVEI